MAFPAGSQFHFITLAVGNQRMHQHPEIALGFKNQSFGCHSERSEAISRSQGKLREAIPS